MTRRDRSSAGHRATAVSRLATPARPWPRRQGRGAEHRHRRGREPTRELTSGGPVLLTGWLLAIAASVDVRRLAGHGGDRHDEGEQQDQGGAGLIDLQRDAAGAIGALQRVPAGQLQFEPAMWLHRGVDVLVPHRSACPPRHHGSERARHADACPRSRPGRHAAAGHTHWHPNREAPVVEALLRHILDQPRPQLLGPPLLPRSRPPWPGSPACRPPRRRPSKNDAPASRNAAHERPSAIQSVTSAGLRPIPQAPLAMPSGACGSATPQSEPTPGAPTRRCRHPHRPRHSYRRTACNCPESGSGGEVRALFAEREPAVVRFGPEIADVGTPASAQFHQVVQLVSDTVPGRDPVGSQHLALDRGGHEVDHVVIDEPLPNSLGSEIRDLNFIPARLSRLQVRKRKSSTCPIACC